ncbi:hypothetical protein CBR_g30588 [Chara braunii]|uniref:Uncharacterized protein n=1 Tax=Chara braunii TaxID=69332 RepID=A0A388LD28_CHABU|nr:hypothetical protein CBR_g30588 [Chara braunii]|eukprot:GBG80221.1 hypothetical protein CBR_g30588 [Chara braunii]
MASCDVSQPLEIDQPVPMALKLHKYKPNCHTMLVFTVLLSVAIMAILLNLDLEPPRFPVTISHPLGGASRDWLSSTSFLSREPNPVQSAGRGRTRTILMNNQLAKHPEGTVVDGTVAEKATRNEASALVVNGRPDSSGGTAAPQNSSIVLVGNRTAESSPHVQPIRNETMASDAQKERVGSSHDTEKKDGYNSTIVVAGNRTTDSSRDVQLRGDDSQLTQKETVVPVQKEVALEASHDLPKHVSTVIVLVVNKTVLVVNGTVQSSRDSRAAANATKLPATVTEQGLVDDRTRESSPNAQPNGNGTIAPDVKKQSVQSSQDDVEKKGGENATTVVAGNKTIDSLPQDVQSRGNDAQPTPKETAARMQKEETGESYSDLQKRNQSAAVVAVVANKPADSSQDAQPPANITKLPPTTSTLNSSTGGAFAAIQQQISKLVAEGKLGRTINEKLLNSTGGSGEGAAGNPLEGNGARLIEPVKTEEAHQDSNTAPPPPVIPTQTLVVSPVQAEAPHQDSNTALPPPVIPTQTLVVSPVQAVQPAPVINQPPFEFGHGIPPHVGTLEDYMISIDMGGDCVKGFECKFTLTTKLYYTAVAFNREIMVLLDGPELLVPDIENTVTYRTWCASFWPWAAGAYNVQIRSDCAGILMATSFSLVVHEPNVSVAEQNERRPASPCEKGTRGRWFRTPSGVYVWKTWEECDPDRAQPSNWVALLNSRGIREINFVGDSHLRVLSQHLRTLVEGGFSLNHVGYHGDIFHTIVGENGTSLTLNFYWVDGIYLNNEFGCINRGMFSGRQGEFPSNISQTADILISNSAAWTWAYCVQAKEAYDKHFPEYVAWIKSSLGPKTKWVVRSEAPFNGHDLGCSRRTNNGMRYANNMARETAKKEGAEFFNAWNIEGARFLENCGAYDPHYSCPYTFLGVAKMWGPVGEAVVTDFMHLLIYGLKH